MTNTQAFRAMIVIEYDRRCAAFKQRMGGDAWADLEEIMWAMQYAHTQGGELTLSTVIVELPFFKAISELARIQRAASK